MRSPEMSYSPAYYQDQGPLGTTHPRSSIVTPPPATRRSQEQSSILGHPVGGSRPSSPIPSRDVSPRTSGSRAHRVYHNQTLGGPSWPGSDIRETDSVPAGSTSSGAHKEERAPSSWADRPSLMSGEHSNPSIIRVRKRAIPDDEIITNEGQDALLMLFRLTIVPLYSFGASLYTIFALLFALLVSPFRLCSFSSYLRATTFASQLCDLLSPILHIHERLVCLQPPSAEDRSSSTPSTQWNRSEPDSDQPSVISEPSEVYAVTTSIFVLVLSPLLSIVILLFAWTAAFSGFSPWSWVTRTALSGRTMVAPPFSESANGGGHGYAKPENHNNFQQEPARIKQAKSMIHLTASFTKAASLPLTLKYCPALH